MKMNLMQKQGGMKKMTPIYRVNSIHPIYMTEEPFMPVGSVIDLGSTGYHVKIGNNLEIIVSSQSCVDKLARFFIAKVEWSSTVLKTPSLSPNVKNKKLLETFKEFKKLSEEGGISDEKL